MKTLHLGPDEVLVAAKIAVSRADTAADVAADIDAAEARIRAAVPIARLIYLEPDLRRAGEPGCRGPPRPPPARRPPPPPPGREAAPPPPVAGEGDSGGHGGSEPHAAVTGTPPGRPGPAGRRGRRRPGDRRRGHRRGGGPGRRQSRAVGRAAGGAGLGGGDVEPVQQADPRRPALPRAVRLPAGARGALRTLPAGADDRTAPGDAAAVPAPTHRAGLAAGVLRRGGGALRRARCRLHPRPGGGWAGDTTAPAPVPTRDPGRLPRATG